MAGPIGLGFGAYATAFAAALQVLRMLSPCESMHRSFSSLQPAWPRRSRCAPRPPRQQTRRTSRRRAHPQDWCAAADDGHEALAALAAALEELQAQASSGGAGVGAGAATGSGGAPAGGELPQALEALAQLAPSFALQQHLDALRRGGGGGGGGAGADELAARHAQLEASVRALEVASRELQAACERHTVAAVAAPPQPTCSAEGAGAGCTGGGEPVVGTSRGVGVDAAGGRGSSSSSSAGDGAGDASGTGHEWDAADWGLAMVAVAAGIGTSTEWMVSLGNPGGLDARRKQAPKQPAARRIARKPHCNRRVSKPRRAKPRAAARNGR